MPSEVGTRHKKLTYAISLSCVMASVIVALWFFVPVLESALRIDVRAPWENPDGVTLLSGPSWFLYDQTQKILKTARPINDNGKRALQALLPQDVKDRSYLRAVDELAYSSNQAFASRGVTSLIIALGALCGILGVLSRSISSFVFHACVLEDLDLVVWWPWYLLRPFLGASVGVTLIVLLKSKLIPLDEPDQDVGFWLLGLCILAGFGIDEFTNRLFYMSRTLFGEAEAAPRNGTSPRPQAEPRT
jgi:hypothetical protein